MIYGKIKVIEATAFYHYLIEYLLVSNNIEDRINDLDNCLFNESFRDILSSLIEADEESNYLDSFMQKNMDKLLNFLLEKDYNMYINVYEKYYSYRKIKDGSFYANQLFLKYNSLDTYANNKCIMWDVQDMRDSVIYDFAIYSALLSNDASAYINEQFSKFTLNKKFLYFVHKLINQYPDIFSDKNMKIKIKTILMYNSLLSNAETEKMIEFCIKNNIINLDDNSKHKEYQNLISDNDKLLKIIDNNMIYSNPCNISAYINAYNEVITLNSLYKDGEIPHNALMLDYVVKKIKEINHHDFTVENKKIFIDVLATLRPHIGKDQISIYNECIAYINSHPISETTVVNARYLDTNRLNSFHRIILKIYKTIYDEQDIGNKNIYEAMKYFFDNLNNNNSLSLFDLKELELIIKALLRIYPKLITNNDIYEKIESAIDLLPNIKKKRINNKIKKIQKRKM